MQENQDRLEVNGTHQLLSMLMLIYLVKAGLPLRKKHTISFSGKDTGIEMNAKKTKQVYVHVSSPDCRV